MLSNPSILFLNCLGSYFYSIVGYMEKSIGANSLLYFLSGNSLKYKMLDFNEIQKKYGNNPWGYQPISIVNGFGDSVKIDSYFFDYLKNMFNIKIEKIEMSHNKELFDYLLSNNLESCFHICKVDEFFLKNSRNFYMKDHNRHYLLIRKVDINKKSIDIIDSEKNEIYTITFEELYKAFYENKFHNKIYYRIDCSNFTSSICYDDIVKLYFAANHDIEYLMSLLYEMEQKLNAKENEKEYYYRGYRYTILSKIIPMIEMRKYLFFKYTDKDIVNLVNTLSSLWNELCTFMLYKSARNDFLFSPLKSKFSKIYEQEERLSCYMRNNSKNIRNN